MRRVSTNFILALGLTATAFLSGPATARAAQQKPSSMALDDAGLPVEAVRATRFVLLDRNKDGYLSIDEADKAGAVLRSQFHALDEDNDGRLDHDEYTLFGRAD